MKFRMLLMLAVSAAFLWACEVTVTQSDGDATTPTPSEDVAQTDTGQADATVEDAGPSTGDAEVAETACDVFCEDASIYCVDDNAMDWGDSDCLTVCATWTSNADYEPGDGGSSLECRDYHVQAAAEDPAVHCPHASADGGGVCVDEVQYFAVFIEDLFGGTSSDCGTSGAPGADIDAVELRTTDGDTLSYWEYVVMGANPEGDTTCNCDSGCSADENANGVDDIYEDVEQAKGEPDGTLTTNFISLYGGWVIGEFGSDEDGDPLYVMDTDVVVVYEVGKANPNVGKGIDEPYSVSLATDIECVNQDNFRETCLMPLGDQDAYAEV
ncbi:MAG: hypothetical protein VYE15_02875, partial [Myxococcota bacterium]|nr:hypothetical protein [Myxococcota bacterium]